MSDLEKYINKTKNLKLDSPLLSSDEIRNILLEVEQSGAAESDDNSPQSNNKSKIILRSLIMLSATAISAFFLWFTMITSNNETALVQEKPSAQNQQVQNTKAGKDLQSGINMEEHNEEPAPDKSFTIPVIHLDQKEMGNLGFKYIGSNLSLDYESLYNPSLLGKKQYQYVIQKQYPEGIPNSIYKSRLIIYPDNSFFSKSETQPYNNQDVTLADPTRPVALFGAWRKDIASKGFFSTSFGFSPLIDTAAAKFLFLELYNLYPAFQQTEIQDNLQIKEETSNYIKQLVCVHFTLKGTDNTANIYVWYLPNKKFIAKLNTKNQALISNQYKLIEYLKNDPSTNKRIGNSIASKSNTLNNNIKQSEKALGDFHAIEVNKNEALKLGLRINNDTIKYQSDVFIDYNKIPEMARGKVSEMFSAKGIDTSYKRFFIKTDNAITIEGTSQGGDDKFISWSTTEYNKVCVVGIKSTGYTFEDGTYKQTSSVTSSSDADWIDTTIHPIIDFMINDDSDINLSNFNKLTYIEGNKAVPFASKVFPVKVRLGNMENKTNDNKYCDIIIWFAVTSEFINALPQEYSEKLKKELSIYKDFSTGIIDNSEACSRINGKSEFLNLCVNVPSFINTMSIYPNPVIDNIFININSEQSETLKLGFYDLAGSKISESEEAFSINKGENLLTYNKGSLKTGLYLLLIKFSSGEQVLQKVFVK